MAAPGRPPCGPNHAKRVESQRVNAVRFAAMAFSPAVPKSTGHGATLPRRRGGRPEDGHTGEAFIEPSSRRGRPYIHPRGNVSSMAMELLPPTCVDGRGSRGCNSGTGDGDGEEGSTSWEDNVGAKIIRELLEEHGDRWTGEAIVKYIEDCSIHLQHDDRSRACDSIAIAEWLARQAEEWTRRQHGSVEDAATVLSAAKRLLDGVKRRDSGGYELWKRWMETARKQVDAATRLHREWKKEKDAAEEKRRNEWKKVKDAAEERIHKHNAEKGYKCVPVAALTRVIERESTARGVSLFDLSRADLYSGVAARLANRAIKQRDIGVREPTLALQQAADLMKEVAEIRSVAG